MTTTAEQRFTEELRLGTERLKREIGYNPTYFTRMVAELGPVQASKRLIHSDTVSDGFTTLWEHERLDMTVEALSLLPWYAALFDDDDRRRSRMRLEQYGLDVDAFLSERIATPAAWWDPSAPETV